MEYAIIIDSIVVNRLVCTEDFALKYIEDIDNAEISNSIEAQVGTIKQGDSFVRIILPVPPAEAKILKCQQIDIYRDTLFYSDVDVSFPTGIKTIRFRNVNDRRNFLDVVTGALSLKVDGKGNDEVSFITVDNNIQTLTANEMVVIGDFVLQKQKALIYTARLKKDTINALPEDENLQTALDSFSITDGWV